MSLDALPFGIAHHMALLPAVAVLVWRRKDVALWVLAAAFGISWIADWAAHVADPKMVSLVYPVSQAGIVLAVLLEKRLALAALGMIVVAAVVSVLTFHGAWPDLTLRAVCWGAIVGAVWHRDLAVRPALLVYFGLGLVAWAGYVALPGWTSWGIYQLVRLAGLGLFSVAVWRMR